MGYLGSDYFIIVVEVEWSLTSGHTISSLQDVETGEGVDWELLAATAESKIQGFDTAPLPAGKRIEQLRRVMVGGGG